MIKMSFKLSLEVHMLFQKTPKNINLNGIWTSVSNDITNDSPKAVPKSHILLLLSLLNSFKSLVIIENQF